MAVVIVFPIVIINFILSYKWKFTAENEDAKIVEDKD